MGGPKLARFIIIKEYKMTDSQKLDLIIQPNEILASILSTFIRTMERKGIIDQSTFSVCAAFGKGLDMRNLVFGVDKK